MPTPRRSTVSLLQSATGCVVCGIDFSQGSATALRYAAALAARASVGVVAVHVEDDLLRAAAGAAGDRRGFLSTLEADLKAFVQRVLGRPGREVETVVLAGPADERMLGLATTKRALAVVVGTRGRGRASALLLGSTADGLLRSSSLPVLAVPPGAGRGPINLRRWPARAVVAVESGPAMRRDVRVALAAAAWCRTTPFPVTVIGVGASERAIGLALDRFGRAIRAATRPDISEIRVRSGDTVGELVAETARIDADLLIARRRARGLFHLFHRSTTTRVRRKLAVPLLVLPPGTSWVRRMRVPAARV